MTTPTPDREAGASLAVRILDEADLDAATEVIVHAFRTDPGAIHLVPDARERDAALAPIFARNVRSAIRSGLALGVGPAGRLDGVLLADPPDVVADPEAEPMDRRQPATWSSVPGFADRLGPFFDAINSLSETGLPSPQWYLGFLATEPAEQGRGVASALLSAFHATATPDGVPIGLLTFVSTNVAFYERRGYRITEARAFAPGGFEMWAMVRGPSGGRPG